MIDSLDNSIHSSPMFNQNSKVPYLGLLLAPLLGLMTRPLESKDWKVEFELFRGEYWWGGLSVDGSSMPYDASTEIERDMMNNRGNQAQPLLISSNGRYVWSEQPFVFKFSKGKLSVTSEYGQIDYGKHGKSLKEVFDYVSKKYFPPKGKIPDPLLFTAPQYNTWIELMYNQNEVDILRYGQSIVDRDYPPGVLMIDDNWQEDYGDWKFSNRRFTTPVEMIDRLHDQGFKIMLWICPFVSADSATFRYLANEGMLFRDSAGTQEPRLANAKDKAAIVRWWNGASALLDLANPKTRQWFQGELDHLVKRYGVDGFKLDAGDARFYYGGIISYDSNALPVDHTTYFARLGLRYPLNEFRASWKMAGEPLAQRLRDKRHSWKDLSQLIPGIIAQGMMGYAFTCPDMIGGGEYQSFLNANTIDQELVVRSAQVSALMPMMQFSVAPWRVLNHDNEAICRDMARLHADFGEEILGLAKESAKSGEPIVKPLAWFWPDRGYETIHDQFILGDRILVAPVLTQGARSRKLVVPPGTWKGEDGSVVSGPSILEIQVPLDRLPYYRKQFK